MQSQMIVLFPYLALCCWFDSVNLNGGMLKLWKCTTRCNLSLSIPLLAFSKVDKKGFHELHPLTNFSNRLINRILEKFIITQQHTSSHFLQICEGVFWSVKSLKWIDSHFLFLHRNRRIMGSELKAWMLISHQLMLFRENPIIDCCYTNTTRPYCFHFQCN